MSESKTTAAIAVAKIEDDILDRRGLGELATFDDEVRSEIRAAWTGIVAQATLDACDQAEPRIRREERDRILSAVDRLMPANFQPGSVSRLIREALARAVNLPVETASERGLAIAAAREEGIALGKASGRVEAFAECAAEAQTQIDRRADGDPRLDHWMREARPAFEHMATWATGKAEP